MVRLTLSTQRPGSKHYFLLTLSSKITLSSYLLQHHSGYFVNPSAANLRLALLCASYLTLPCFSPCLDLTDVEVSVYKGDYAFQEYAALNWIHHIKCLTDHGELATNVDMSSLKTAVVILFQRHFAQFATDNSDSSTQDLEFNMHSISAALDNCQKSYDMVDNICVNETDSGKVMALSALECG